MCRFVLSQLCLLRELQGLCDVNSSALISLDDYILDEYMKYEPVYLSVCTHSV